MFGSDSPYIIDGLRIDGQVVSQLVFPRLVVRHQLQHLVVELPLMVQRLEVDELMGTTNSASIGGRHDSCQLMIISPFFLQ